MKKLCAAAILWLAFTIITFCNTVAFTETFESGLPTSAPSTETSAGLGSGTWLLNGAFGKSDNGSTRLAMNTNGYAILPTLSQPVSISFNHRGSGSGKVLTVEKSVNGGAWESVGTATVSSASAYGSSTITIGEAGSQNVRIRLVCGSATIYVDNVVVEVSEMPAEPTTQALLQANTITGSTISLHITPGNGQGRMLIYRKTTDVTWLPEDGTTYQAGNWADENHLIYSSGNDTSILVSGLVAGETYSFAAFEYNGIGVNRNYNSSLSLLMVKTSEVPTITISHASLNFGVIKTGTIEKRECTISAKFLQSDSGDITLVTGTDFSISQNISSGYSSSTTLRYKNYKLDALKLYIQFAPQQLVVYSDSLVVSGDAAPSAILKLYGTGSNTDAKVYYIAPNGDDTNAGTFDAPLKNLQVAVDKMLPGDTIFVRGGTYYPNFKKDGTKTTVRLTTIGTAQKKLCIFNYPGEFPILNFKDQPKAQSVRGIQLDGNFWHLKGLHITEAGDNGIKLEGNNNIVEGCTFSYNDDTGIQLGFGHVFSDTHPGISNNDGTYCANNLIINCDSYFNYDTDNFGSDADGFACKMHNGRNNRFVRCRAWDNSDDAWDLYETDFPVYIIECWGWGSGRASNFPQGGGSFQGNGNGIKMGGNGTGGSSEGKHEAWYCIAFNNNKSGSVKGFDQNSHKGGVKLVNCLSFGNGYDYMFETADGVREFFNNVCFGSLEIAAGALQGNNASLTSPSQGWTNNVCNNFSASDYNSLAESDAKKPRGADGSMPTTFARIKASSPLLNKGTIVSNLNSEIFDLGLPWSYSGANPDLGPYEYLETPTSAQIIINKENISKLEIFPNPVKNYGTISFSSKNSGECALSVYNLNGSLIKEITKQKIVSGIDYYLPLDVTRLKTGTYMVTLRLKDEIKVARLVVTGK